MPEGHYPRPVVLRRRGSGRGRLPARQVGQQEIRVHRVLGRLSRQDRGRDRPSRRWLSQPPGAVPDRHALAPYANCYRCPWNLEFPSCGLACAEHLRNVIKNETQDEVAAIIIEPMQGTAGNVIPPDDFIHAVRDIADECGALLIADEILTGFGRTGTMWACEQFDLKPDIMTIGKGMGGGFPLERRRLLAGADVGGAVRGAERKLVELRRKSACRSRGSRVDGGLPRRESRGEFGPRRRAHARRAEAAAGEVPLHRRRAGPGPDDRRRDGGRPQDQGAARQDHHPRPVP